MSEVLVSSTVTKVLKKRGRKPKVIDSEVEIKTEKVLKKRGRKSKPKSYELEKVPKKRGRKPKISNVTTEHTEMEPLKNIILHLPINFDENIENTPKPFDESSLFSEVKINSKVLKETKNNDLSNNLEKYIKEREEVYNQNNFIFLQYIENNKKKEWPKHTNYDCLWDSHPFNNMPFGIPIKKDNNTLYLFGNFCSPECAAAYCFSLNDNIWERYSLLNEIYGRGAPIRIANSKLLLKNFGGIYSIDEFRILNINNCKKYKICLPPVLSLIPTLEETNIDINDNLILDKADMKKNNKYKLKRSKPINSKNSLENIMDLKYL